MGIISHIFFCSFHFRFSFFISRILGLVVHTYAHIQIGLFSYPQYTMQEKKRFEIKTVRFNLMENVKIIMMILECILDGLYIRADCRYFIIFFFEIYLENFYFDKYEKIFLYILKLLLCLKHFDQCPFSKAYFTTIFFRLAYIGK